MYTARIVYIDTTADGEQRREEVTASLPESLDTAIGALPTQAHFRPGHNQTNITGVTVTDSDNQTVLNIVATKGPEDGTKYTILDLMTGEVSAWAAGYTGYLDFGPYVHRDWIDRARMEG